MVVVMAFVANSAMPSEARACSIAFEPAYVGYPADGSHGVPTDVQLTFDGYALWNETLPAADVAVTFTASSGESIEASVEQPYIRTYTVTPRAALEPNTTYTVQIAEGAEAPHEPWTIAFTTGAGPFANTVSAPEDAFLRHYRLMPPFDDLCGPPQNGTCVAVPEGIQVEARFIDDLGQTHEPYLHHGAYFTNLSGIDQGTNFECVELRTRAPNGAISDPVVLCGDDAESVDVDDASLLACTAEGIPAPVEIDEREGGGCRVSPSRPCSGTGALALLIVFGLRRARRRRG